MDSHFRETIIASRRHKEFGEFVRPKTHGLQGETSDRTGEQLSRDDGAKEKDI